MRHAHIRASIGGGFDHGEGPKHGSTGRGASKIREDIKKRKIKQSFSSMFQEEQRRKEEQSRTERAQEQNTEEQ